MTCSKYILRQIAFGNHQLVRNIFILCLSTLSCYQLTTADEISNVKPIISEVIPVAMSNFTIPVVEYAEVKDLPNHPEKLLIDVREPNELKETGKIPTSINIPLGIVSQELALDADSEEFQKKYGRPKPDINSYIIVSCRSGRRSLKAAEIATALGYKNIHNYAGSWLDWAEHEGLPI